MNTKLNKTDWILIGTFYLISTVVNCIQYYIQDNDLIEYLVDIPAAIVLSLAIVLMYLLWLVPEYIVKKKQYVTFFGLGIVVLSVLGTIDYTIGFWSGSNPWSEFPKWYWLLFEGVLQLDDDVGLLFGLLLGKKFYESQMQLLKVEKRQKENELKLLRSQVDPHFLFNNLNTLDSLIDSNADKAKEYINRLSLIYRYLIKTKDAEVMELEQEMQLAENYIFLIQTRFGDDYDFEIIKKTSTEGKFIPTGALQTLLENVVKHNKPKDEPIKTKIELQDTVLTVWNTKSTVASDKESFGTGLENLKTRYQLLSDEKVRIESNTNTFCATIPVLILNVEE